MVSNPAASDKIYGDVPEPTADSFLCDEVKPFFNGTKCIDCDVLFISETNSCGTCPDGSNWNTEVRMCENEDGVPMTPVSSDGSPVTSPEDINATNATDTNTTEENMTMVSNPSAADRAYGEIPDASDNSTVCDEATPFFNGE